MQKKRLGALVLWCIGALWLSSTWGANLSRINGRKLYASPTANIHNTASQTSLTLDADHRVENVLGFETKAESKCWLHRKRCPSQYHAIQTYTYTYMWLDIHSCGYRYMRLILSLFLVLQWVHSLHCNGSVWWASQGLQPIRTKRADSLLTFMALMQHKTTYTHTQKHC